MDVIVIGGGVSGLSTAFHLAREGHQVMVLERRVGIGGNAISERIGGYLMEHGPSTVNATVPEVLELTRQLDMETDRLELQDAVRQRYLVKNGHLTGIPLHGFGFLVSDYLSIRGRISVLTEIARRRRDRNLPEESVHDFVSRRFGDEFATRVMEPLVAGLFAGDDRTAAMAALMPRLVEFEQNFGSVTRALLRARGGSEPGKRLFSWMQGVGALPAGLAGRLGKRIRTGALAKSIRKTPAGFDVETPEGTVRSRALVLAVQPHVAAGLLAPVDEESAEAANEIEAPPLATVFFGFRRDSVEHPLDGVGFLSPRQEARTVTGVQFCSTMFAGRAPEGCVSLSAYVGGARNPAVAQLPAEDLVALVKSDLVDLLGVRGEPEVVRVRHWSRGLPQYTLGHGGRVLTLEATSERVPGLFVTGNFMKGVSIGNCMAAARRTAELVDGHLQDRQFGEALAV